MAFGLALELAMAMRILDAVILRGRPPLRPRRVDRDDEVTEVATEPVQLPDAQGVARAQCLEASSPGR